MQKTTYRNNNTYVIVGNSGDNPKLMGQVLNDGRDSLYLEFYLGYEKAESKNGKPYKKIKRRSERLGLYLWRAPRTPDERTENKRTLELAKKLRFERNQEMLESAEGYRIRSEINFHTWYDNYVRRYTKGDVYKIKHYHKVFKEFLAEKYPDYVETMKPDQLTREMMVGFTDYLCSRFHGETPLTAYKRFKKVVKAMVDAEVIKKNPCAGVTIKYDHNKLTKEVLSLEEVRTLLATPYRGNPDIRRAFIFSLYCGVRHCDVKDLKYGDVDYSNRILRFEQSKTKGHSSTSGVVIPLNDALLRIIGEGERDERIFPIPSGYQCGLMVQRWVDDAGIRKHITWHCARHSFATNLLALGANIKTVSSLLGHSSIQMTEKYTRVVDRQKVDAINSLPDIPL